jgi:hypothetical protein
MFRDHIANQVKEEHYIKLLFPKFRNQNNHADINQHQQKYQTQKNQTQKNQTQKNQQQKEKQCKYFYC